MKRHSKNQYLQKLFIFLLIFKVSTSKKIIIFTVFSTEITSQLAIAAPKNTMKSIITNHNKTILDKSQTLYKKNLHCINKNTCPLNEECQADNIIYQASEIPFKNDSPNIKSHLATSNIKTKQNFQRKYGILRPLFKWKVENSYTSGKKPSKWTIGTRF